MCRALVAPAEVRKMQKERERTREGRSARESLRVQNTIYISLLSLFYVYSLVRVFRAHARVRDRVERTIVMLRNSPWSRHAAPAPPACRTTMQLLRSCQLLSLASLVGTRRNGSPLAKVSQYGARSSGVPAHSLFGLSGRPIAPRAPVLRAVRPGAPDAAMRRYRAPRATCAPVAQPLRTPARRIDP
jgi:hypothetical protein